MGILDAILTGGATVAGHFAKKEAAKKQQYQQALNARYSPWTGVSTGDFPQTPSAGQSLAQGATALLLMNSKDKADKEALKRQTAKDALQKQLAEAQIGAIGRMSRPTMPEQAPQYGLGANIDLGQIPAWMKMGAGRG